VHTKSWQNCLLKFCYGIIVLVIAYGSYWYCHRHTKQLLQQYQQLNQQPQSFLLKLLAQQQTMLRQQQILLTNYTNNGINQAHMLISQANNYLLLGAKAEQIILMLQQAQLALPDNKEDKVSAVKFAIASDISALKAIAWPDITQLQQKLLALERSLWQTPLNQLSPANTADLATNCSTWQQWLASTVKHLIIIQRDPINDMQPGPTPEARLAIRQHLLSLVHLSLWATLAHNQQMYNFSLAELKSWLTTTANGFSATTMLLTTIEELAAVKLNPATELKLQSPAAIAKLQAE
jgi:uncharacterized protein HemX